MSTKKYEAIEVEKKDGIAWVRFNRPDKRNAISPQVCYDMEDALMALETDDEARVIVLAGNGEAWSAGMDLKEYFRALDNDPNGQYRAWMANKRWSWEILATSRKPTIAMVHGYCFGGAFISLCACDIAIASDKATFGLSEINWGILPGGIVSKVIRDFMSQRDAMFYSMTGRQFNGKQAAEMKLVSLCVPHDQLEAETIKLANELMEKPPVALAYTKQAVRAVGDMDLANSYEYLNAKIQALRWADKKNVRDQGISKFVDEKTYRPGMGTVPQD